MGVRLEEIRIRGVAEGLDRVTAELKDMEAAERSVATGAQPLAAGLEKASREALSAANALRRVETAINPATAEVRKHEAALRSLSQARQQNLIDDARQASLAAAETQRHQIAVRQIEERMALQRRLYAAGAGNDNDRANRFGLRGYQVGNLRSQGLDAATMLASGSSITQVLSTQGAQVYEALAGSEKGVKGVFAEAGTAAMGFARALGPVGIGLTAASAAAGYFYLTNERGMPDATKALEGYSDLLGRLRDGYAGAADAAENFYRSNIGETREVAQASIQARLSGMRGQMREQMKGIGTLDVLGLDDSTVGSAMNVGRRMSASFREGQDRLRELYTELLRGDRTVESFRQGVAEVALNPAFPESIRDAADGINAATQNTQKLEVQMRALEAAAAAASEKMGRLGTTGNQPVTLGDRFGQNPVDYRMNPDLMDDLKEKLSRSPAAESDRAFRSSRLELQTLVAKTSAVGEPIGRARRRLRAGIIL